MDDDRTETCHFWVGHVPQEVAGGYFAENYDVEDRDEEPLSPFARDQGVGWYDHDFLEYGWGEAAGIGQLVAGYSYSEQWADELARRVAAEEITGVNFFVFINQEQIEAPRSVQGDGYWLRYMGTIGYRT